MPNAGTVGAMSTKLMAAVFCVVAVAGAADQRPVPSHQPAPAPRAAARLTQPALSDPQLEAAIRARFARSKIDADHFKVRVQGGVATLEGRTNVIQHKGVATRMAKNAGAVAVTNRIEVSDAARAKAAGSLEQGRRRAQVTRGEPRSQPDSTAHR
jgi:osmotically-inducible protein OsmY